MKRILFFTASIFMLLGISGYSQDNPRRSDGAAWLYGTYSPKANFFDLHKLGLDYFKVYKDSDNTYELYNRFKVWSDLFGSRSIWADNPQDSMAGVYKATADLNAAAITLPANHPYSDWKLKSADTSDVQNLGVVTSIWQDPAYADSMIIGTEASGIWKYNPSIKTWKNISDTYTGALTGFGVSSLDRNGTKILAGSFNPTMDLFIGNGIGLLFSPDNGANWNQLLPAYMTNNSFLTNDIIWKAKYNSVHPGVFAWFFCLGDTIYNINPSNPNFFNPGFKIAVPHPNDHGWLESRIRDFELSDSLWSNATSKDYQMLCFSTDGFYRENIRQNAELFYTCGNFFTPFMTTPHQIILPYDSVNNFIEYISIDQYTTGNPDNIFYVVYREVSKTDPTISRIHIGVLKKNVQYVSYLTPLYYHEYYTAPITNNFNSVFGGFGYRYNAFETYNYGGNIKFAIGGYYLTLVDYDAATDATGTVQLIKPDITPYTESDTYNKQCHYGIRDLSIQYDPYSSHVANEGGISSFIFRGGVSKFTNINYKGLAIAQVKNLSSSKYSATNVLVHSSYRNGYWSKACDYPWHSTAFMDGGSSKVVDSQLDYNSYTQGFANAPTNYFGITNNEIPYNPTTSLSYYPDQLYFSSNAWLYDQGYCATPTKTAIPTTNFADPWWLQPCAYAAPLAIRPDTANLFYLAHHDIYQTNNLDGFSWPRISDTTYGYPSLSHWAWWLQALEFAPSSKDTMFAIFPNRTEGKDESGHYPVVPAGHKIYRGVQINNIWHWTDLTNDSLPYILQWRGLTDIAVNPDNSKELWITLDQYSGHIMNGEYRVMHTTDGGLSWDDYSTGLSCVPVNSIVLNKESNLHDLYVANDMGVFYRNDTMSSWKPYMQNLPRCMVMDLEINYERMELYAGTWGRGVWVSPVPCYSQMPQDITVSSSQTWSTPKYNCGNIVVNSGVTLTVNTTVEMGIGKEIRVKPGATLNLVNATVTNSCKRYWKGIVVEGNHVMNIFTNGQHGKLYTMNSTISNALVAVQTQSINTYFSTNYGGGELSCHNTTFKNNSLSVHMRPFMCANPVTYNPYIDPSIFSNCNFIYDGNYLLDSTFKGFVFIDSVNYPKFNGCNFKNINTGCKNAIPERKGFGIKANNSTFVAQATYSGAYPGNVGTVTPTVFQNLEYGIRSVAFRIGRLQETKIDNCVFSDNTHGAYCFNNPRITVLSNDFTIPKRDITMNADSSGQPYGLYLERCEYFKIEHNGLHLNTDADSGYIGMLIVNCGRTPKLIYNNDFRLLNYGLIAIGDNGYRDPLTCFVIEGVKIKCNDFQHCGFDVGVDTIGTNDPLLEGISVYQGELSSFSIPDSIMRKTANNRFSHAGNLGVSDLYNIANPFTYYFYNEYPQEPVYYSMNTVFPSAVTGGVPFDKTKACPPMYALYISDSPVVQGDFVKLDSICDLSNSQKLLYQIYLDGGKSGVLKNEISSCYPWESYIMFDKLMAISPYLSEESMIEAVVNEAAFPPAMIRLLMLANPQCLHSDQVWGAIYYKRATPLPESIIQELLNAPENYSPLEQMRTEISWTQLQKYAAFEEIISRFSNEPQSWILDTLITKCKQQKEFTMIPHIVNLYLGSSRLEEASEFINASLSGYNLNADEENQWLQLKAFYEIAISLVNSAPNAEQTEQLQNMMQSQYSSVSGSAKALYAAYNGNYPLTEIIKLPAGEPQNKSVKTRRINNEEPDKLLVNPNPAHDFITVSYQLPADVSNAALCIYDATGRKYHCTAADKSGNTIIGLKGLVKGIYICALESNGSVLKSVKFSVY